MAHLLFKDVNKVYPNGYYAVHDFNMEIKDIKNAANAKHRKYQVRVLPPPRTITSGFTTQAIAASPFPR